MEESFRKDCRDGMMARVEHAINDIRHLFYIVLE